MDRKEMEAKLTKHGLPTWGEDAQLKARLEANGIVPVFAKGKITETFEQQKIDNANLAAQVKAIAANPKPAVVAAPRRMGRPKKVK